jgi:hypothetical protein
MSLFHEALTTVRALGMHALEGRITPGHRFKPGHPAPSMTCRYGLTALPGQGQRVDL